MRLLCTDISTLSFCLHICASLLGSFAHQVFDMKTRKGRYEWETTVEKTLNKYLAKKDLQERVQASLKAFGGGKDEHTAQFVAELDEHFDLLQTPTRQRNAQAPLLWSFRPRQSERHFVSELGQVDAEFPLLHAFVEKSLQRSSSQKLSTAYLRQTDNGIMKGLVHLPQVYSAEYAISVVVGTTSIVADGRAQLLCMRFAQLSTLP